MDPMSETATPHYSFNRKSPFECDTWELRENALPALQDLAVSESLFSIGNGFIGVRGFPEESRSLLNASYLRNHEPNRNSGVAAVGSSCSGSTINAGGMSTSSGAPWGAPPIRATTQRASSSQATSPVGLSQAASHSEVVVPAAPLRGCYVAGFCEHRLLLNRTRAFTVGQCSKESFLVRVPNPFCIDVFVGGEHVSIATGAILQHNRRLDLRTGELRCKVVWESHAHRGREITIESSRFLSARRTNIGAIRFRVSAKNVNGTDIRVLSRTEIPDDATTQRACGVESLLTRYSIQEAVSVVQVRTRNSCKHLVVATLETCNSVKQRDGGLREFSGASEASVGSSASENGSFTNSPIARGASGGGGRSPNFPSAGKDAGDMLTPTSLAPRCGETDSGTETFFTSIISEHVTLELNKIVGFFAEDDAPQEELGDLALQRVREAAVMGYDALARESRAELSRFWETADIRFKGSRSVQGAIRYNMMQIHMACGTSAQHGYPTRGLTGECMGGVHQWDVDTLVIPALTHMCPEKARTLLQFRINTLFQAKSIAGDLDLPRGAVYPFRTITGTENPAPYCGAFLFVNAVVVNAMRHYVTATNDYSVLADGGAEVVVSTALVWLEWGTWEKGRFHLRSVSGPDMYAGELNDNFFTNLLAQQHMQWTVQVAAYFRETWLVRWKEILEHSLATEEDIARLDRAASKMVLLFDGERRVHPVDDSFMHKKPWTFEDLSERKGEALLHRYHPAVLYRHQVCRIPDVLLAMVLLPEHFTQDEYRANFNFYAGTTSSDSALRYAINGVIAAQLRIMDKAMANFTGTLFVDLDNVMGNTGGGLHLTTAAGAWWTLATGFGGMRVVQGTLHFNPILPQDCEELQFFARHRGCLIRVLVTQRMVTYTLESSTKEVNDLLLIHAESSRIHLRKGIPETVRLFREIRVFDFDSVIFEMDSIIDDVEAFHFEAWRETLESYFHENDFPDFTMSQEVYLAYLRHMKPVSGLQELFKRFNRPILPTGQHEDSEKARTAHGLLTRKLQCFRRLVKERGLRFREGTFQLLTNLRQCGIAIGCVSGSKNGRWLLEETPELRFMFDDFLDRNDGESYGLRWRPETDYFDACARNMDSAPDRTVIVMDGTDGFSKLCIERFCLLVDVSNDPEEMQFEIPRLVTRNFTDLTMEVLDEYTARDGVVHHREASAYKRGKNQTSSNRGNSNSDYVSSQPSPINNVQAFPDGLNAHSATSGQAT